MGELKGKCLCGAVTFSASGASSDYHACHCGMCRRWGGGPFFAAGVGGVTFEGEDKLRRYDSSEWAERGFCGDCGTHLFYRLKGEDQYIMSVGAFDNADSFRLHGEIYIDAKPDGYAFAGDHERLTEAETIAKFTGG